MAHLVSSIGCTKGVTIMTRDEYFVLQCINSFYYDITINYKYREVLFEYICEAQEYYSKKIKGTPCTIKNINEDAILENIHCIGFKHILFTVYMFNLKNSTITRYENIEF